MNTNNFTIKDLAAVLTDEDKTYCDELFLQYEDLQKLTKETFVDCNRKLFDYNKANNHLFASGSKILASQMKNVASSMRDITIALINRMESYFEAKYSVNLPSLLESDSYVLHNRLTNYQAVIANMINETGMDFSKGKP